MALIVVESPTKARTFNRILKSKDWGKDYFVFATVGHFRDLPARSMAVDIAHSFAPQYEIMDKKETMVGKLQALAKEHKDIILATDPDREGEAISYHVAQLLGFVTESWPDFTLKKTKHLKRIVFHEITPAALEEALKNPDALRVDLVKAQQARRILDRIVGYELSPLLWKKLNKNWLSAGRVQTVALRIVVEREKEITSFSQEPYVAVTGLFDRGIDIEAKLMRDPAGDLESKHTMTLFDGTYEYTKGHITTDKIDTILKTLSEDTYTITDVTTSTTNRYPPPPYTTSLLQQDSFRKLGFPSKLTMRLAQSLYEKGLITYHRTDSFHLSAKYVFPAKEYIVKAYGNKYALEKPRGYKTKSKNAQEAHEAIRPTQAARSLKDLKDKKMSPQENKLYEMIFNRALATQMKEAEMKEQVVTIRSSSGYEFVSTVQTVLFDGFLRLISPAFVKNHQTDPSFTKNAPVRLKNLTPEEKTTRPPYRYSEASLIKTLEEKGIGRPSTYAAIISLIVEKHYVEKDGRYLKPTLLGTAISDYLSGAFPGIFDLEFTAKLEDTLDDIASGNSKILELLSGFYDPFKASLGKEASSQGTIDVVEDTLEEPCPKCGSALIARYGRYGKFYACKGYPTCKYIKPNLRVVPGHVCPLCGGEVVVRYSKTGKRFYGCSNYPTCKHVQWALNPTVPKK